MNELKLLLDNFQSISSGELVFKTGLNFIIGQSNSGKTATFRALKACLLNPVGSQRFIKRGHSSAQVTMYYNGNEIEWKRTQKDSSYVINGETYIKTGKTDTFKLLDDKTGFVQGDDNTLMNIEEELQLPFPFGLSKSDLFKLYENVFCVSDSATILKSAKDTEDSVKTDISYIDSELSKNKRKKEELENLKTEVDLQLLKEYLKQLNGRKERVETLNDGLSTINKVVELNNIAFGDVIVEDTLSSYTKALELRKLIERLKELHALSKSTEVHEFEDYRETLTEYKEALKIINNLKTYDQITFSTIEILDNLSRYKELVTYYKEIKRIATEGKAKTTELQKAKANLQQLESKLKEFKVCPLCHQPLNN